MKKYFRSKDKTWYQRWIKEQSERWLHQGYGPDLARSDLSPVPIHGLRLTFVTLQQPRRGGSFSEGILCFEG